MIEEIRETANYETATIYCLFYINPGAPTMTTMTIVVLVILCSSTWFATSQTSPLPMDEPSTAMAESQFNTEQTEFAWTFGASAEKTYVLTNCHWWESVDHQLTSVITLLTIAQNTSSIAVIPTIARASSSGGGDSDSSSNNGGTEDGKTAPSLLGEYFDVAQVRQVQSVVTMREFLASTDFAPLRDATTGTVPFPKESQEEYESKLGVFGKLRAAAVHLQMPDVDPENTNQPCHRFGGTMHLSTDGRIRYVFLDRIHFLHFCTEKFMPWWYDVRQHVRPRPAYFALARRFMRQPGLIRPVTVVHVNDVMEAQKERSGDDVDRYAGEIVDGLRAHGGIQANGGIGSVYVMYSKNGRNVRKVVGLLQAEFNTVYECTDLFNCLERVPSEALPDGDADAPLAGDKARWAAEWALAAQADVFIGNVHSPLSRNVCLFRKTQGKAYAIGRGFAELRKVWKWNL